MSEPRNVPDALARRFTLTEVEIALPGLPLRLVKPRNSDDLISEADYLRDERLPYWADLWASSEELARYLLEEREALRRGGARTAIELGCGLGLPSIVASSIGFETLATDYYEDALLFAAHNAERAGVSALRTRMVDWTALPPDLGQFALVLAADVLYEMRYAELVLEVVARTLAPEGVFLLADQGRIALSSFLEAASVRGLHWRAVRRIAPPAGVARPSITIYDLRWRAT